MTVERKPAVPHRVAVLILSPVIGFDATIAPQIFGEATTADGEPLYDVTMCGLTRDPAPTDSGYLIVPTAGPEALAEADTVIIPGNRTPGPRHEGRLSDEAEAALRSVRAGTRWVSICTGAFTLAATGLLDGRRATTHWRFADSFRNLYPAVRLDEDVLYTDEGDVLTSAGLAAGIDLCLHIIRKDHGAQVAGEAARHTVAAPWREGGQAQFIHRPVPKGGGGSTAPARELMATRLSEPISVEQMARACAMSLRTFNRRFREETGSPPGAWLLRARLDHARELLETTDLPVDEIARRAGLGTGASLRQHIRRHVGTSPIRYRHAFRGT